MRAALIEPFGDMVELDTGDVVLNRGEQVQASLFPAGPTMISMAVELNGGRSVEAALIGRKARSAESSAAAMRRPFPAPSSWSAGRLSGADACARGRQERARRSSPISSAASPTICCRK